MVCFMSRRSRGALGGRWTEVESGVSWTSLGVLLGAQTEAELTTQNSDTPLGNGSGALKAQSYLGDMYKNAKKLVKDSQHNLLVMRARYPFCRNIVCQISYTRLMAYLHHSVGH
jgi:hypothetical protein